MLRSGFSGFTLWVLSVSCLLCVSSGFDPPGDTFLINVGSPENITVDLRDFRGDGSYSNFLTTPYDILATTTSDSAERSNNSALYGTARIFNETSYYRFSIKTRGRHWIRLHFFPFVSGRYNLSTSHFSVSAQNFTLIKEYVAEDRPVVTEYSLDISSNELVLEFKPGTNSFAFLNALEVFALPEGLIPEEASVLGSEERKQSLLRTALQTVLRVNMGNQRVNRADDTWCRHWVADGSYLKGNGIGSFVSNVRAVEFTKEVTDSIAPSHVYGTATMLNTAADPTLLGNMTWIFNVDPGFEYLVRLHFCNILNETQQLLRFNVFVNSMKLSDMDRLIPSLEEHGAPKFLDAVTTVSTSTSLHVSVGSIGDTIYPEAILNGLEIMKMNNSEGSLDVSKKSNPGNSKIKVTIAAASAAALFVALVSASAFLFICRRRRKQLHVIHGESAIQVDAAALSPCSKIGYRFPLAVIQEATDNFNEYSLIGVGGFGSVYKGVLKDGTKIAVKRGAGQSQQGLAEFKTEIELLSQFRHRHLVSLIGYCDENTEMIIVYEYMENGTLKDHLYGTSKPVLSWSKRLEICVGAARGLHYLHTGSTKSIIHRDVKSANILLDENLMAKVADFGLSKTGPDLDQTHVSTAVKGSFGYLDPEYLTRQQLTDKSDVYSFGVVMFEVLCGRPVIDPSLPREQANLIEWALKSAGEGRLEEILDVKLGGQVKPEALREYEGIAERCLSERGIDRPTMGNVLWNLEHTLQIQVQQEKSDQPAPSIPVSSTQFSVEGSVGDLAGVSMSKVFAQMVREDMR